jgi:hypothetical protein
VLARALSVGLQSAPPQDVEAARHWLCNFDAIAQFDVTFERLFQSDHRLMINTKRRIVSVITWFCVRGAMDNFRSPKARPNSFT